MFGPICKGKTTQAETRILIRVYAFVVWEFRPQASGFSISPNTDSAAADPHCSMPQDPSLAPQAPK